MFKRSVLGGVVMVAALTSCSSATQLAGLLGPLALRLVRVAREEVSAATKLAAAPGGAP